MSERACLRTRVRLECLKCACCVIHKMLTLCNMFHSLLWQSLDGISHFFVNWKKELCGFHSSKTLSFAIVYTEFPAYSTIWHFFRIKKKKYTHTHTHTQATFQTSSCQYNIYETYVVLAKRVLIIS